VGVRLGTWAAQSRSRAHGVALMTGEVVLGAMLALEVDAPTGSRRSRDGLSSVSRRALAESRRERVGLGICRFCRFLLTDVTRMPRSRRER
jgi:hypothetical protein